MYHRALTVGRLLGTAAAVSSPATLVLAGLVGFGHLGAAAALLAAAAIVALTALIIRPLLLDLSAVAAWVRALASGGETPPPAFRFGSPAGEVVQSVAQLRRAWQRQESVLEGSARWNEALLDSLPDPVLLLDGSRRVVRMNPTALLVFGSAMKGRDLAATLRHPDLLEIADAAMKGNVGGETEITLTSPAERVFRVRVEPVLSRTLDNAAALLILHDLTALRRMERMRADFVANASHELRTPLATLLGFIETLKGPARDDAPARDRFLDIMHEQASRMARLVHDLLSLSRIELDEHRAPSSDVDLNRLLAATAEALQPLARARKMSIRLALPPQPTPVVGQEDQLTQLFQNLMDNAVKYGREGSEVAVELAPADTLPVAAGDALRQRGAVRISVRDRGDGIAREHLPRLTERFYRVDSARSRALGGTGLGLAIVKHIVNRHRGLLTVESKEGEGSCFTVFLPLNLAGKPS